MLDDAEDRDRFWAAATPETDVWQRWLADMRTAPLIIVPHANKDELPRPVRRAGQGLDRPGRVALAGAVLAHRHRVRQPADAAHARSTRAWARASSASRPSGIAAYRAAFGVPERVHPDRRGDASATGADRTASPGRSGAGGTDRWTEVVHRGRWCRLGRVAVAAARRLGWRAAQTRGRPAGEGASRDLQGGPGRSAVPGPRPDLEAVGARSRPGRCAWTSSSPPSGSSALDRLLAEDSTFYGDLFPHVVQWEGGFYLEDGVHRALRAALQQRTTIHARVLVL